MWIQEFSDTGSINSFKVKIIPMWTVITWLFFFVLYQSEYQSYYSVKSLLEISIVNFVFRYFYHKLKKKENFNHMSQSMLYFCSFFFVTVCVLFVSFFVFFLYTDAWQNFKNVNNLINNIYRKLCCREQNTTTLKQVFLSFRLLTL